MLKSAKNDRFGEIIQFFKNDNFFCGGTLTTSTLVVLPKYYLHVIFAVFDWLIPPSSNLGLPILVFLILKIKIFWKLTINHLGSELGRVASETDSGKY